MNNNIEIVRSALNTVFGNRVGRQQIEDATFTGREDPGGWAPRAQVVIHTERGIPALRYDSQAIVAAWDRVNDVLAEHDLFCEPINGAIVAVYNA
jgi:hypothetical protein